MRESRHAASDILAIYTRDVARYKILDPETERALGVRARAGDEEAQEQLVRANLRFVIKIAQRYRHHGVPLMDLIQAGNIGLAHAARKFDPNVGVRFISYAVFWISQQIQKEIDTSDGSVRATQTQMIRNRHIRRLNAEANQTLGRDYTLEELVEKTGYTRERVKEALDYRVTIKSLDEPVSPTDGSTTTLGQVIGHDDDREEAEHEAELHEAVQMMLTDVLSERERFVITNYFGIGDERPLSLTEIGELMGVTRERARQLKERGVKKLRAATHLHPHLLELFTTKAALEERRRATRWKAGPSATDGPDMDTPGGLERFSGVATSAPPAQAAITVSEELSAGEGEEDLSIAGAGAVLVQGDLWDC